MKIPNPMVITKETAPYLYLTDDSGLYLNKYGTDARSIRIPINANLSPDFGMSALQIWVRIRSVPGTIETMLVIDNGLGDEFVVEANPDGYRATITAPAGTSMYLNGYQTEVMYLVPGEWASIMFVMADPISFAESEGALHIYPGYLVNNISLFSHDSSLADINSNASIEVYDNLIGSSVVVASDLGWISVFSNGIDVFTDVKWQTIERTPV